MSISNAIEGIDQTQPNHVRVLVLKNTSTGKTTLVDTGFDEDGEEFVETPEREYGDVDRITTTHDNHGHHGSLPSIMKTLSPELVALANESKFHETIDYELDVTFIDGDLLNGDIRVIEIPGRTKAASALLLEDRGILILGGALDGADRAGLPAGYPFPPPALFNDDHRVVEINLYDLLQYDFETLSVFHGSYVFEGPRGKLDGFLVEREWDLRSE